MGENWVQLGERRVRNKDAVLAIMFEGSSKEVACRVALDMKAHRAQIPSHNVVRSCECIHHLFNPHYHNNNKKLGEG